jgi:hypothetical protein
VKGTYENLTRRGTSSSPEEPGHLDFRGTEIPLSAPFTGGASTGLERPDSIFPAKLNIADKMHV